MEIPDMRSSLRTLGLAAAMAIATAIGLGVVGLGLVGVGIAALTPGAAAQTGTAQADQTADDMLLLRTTAGDILIELFDDAAPQTVAQVRALADAGGYDGMPFVRVINEFIVQAGQVEVHRVPAATAAQLDLVTNLPLETNPAHIHTRGVLSLARFDEPTSGTSSFSIMLNDFPHLDGDYAVFGRVVEGMAVADTLSQIPTNENDYPTSDIQIWKAQTGTADELRAAHFYNTTPSDEAVASISAVPGIASGSTVTAAGGAAAASTAAGTTAALIAAAIFGIAAFLLAGRLEPRFVGALGLLAAMSAGFGLFVALIPSSGPIAGVIFFVCMVGFFRLLSRFESVGSSPSSDKQSASENTEVPDAGVEASGVAASQA